MSHQFEREHTYWRTANGQEIPIKDMADSHLVNVLNWILDNEESYTNDVYNKMNEEAKYRQIILFAEGKPYPQRVNDRWVLIDPVTGEGKIEKPPKEYRDAVKDNEAYQAMSKRTQERRKELRMNLK
jgi:hypothetical protein